MATSTSKLVPTNHKCFIEHIYIPSVADNIKNMRLFDDDEGIIDFLTTDEAFKESVIDDE